MAGGLRFELNDSQIQELENAMKKVPENVEQKVNSILHGKGCKEMMQSIIGFMPVSNRNKKHAKNSNPLGKEDINLGFRIFAKGGAANKKGSFGYLVFPNEGRGSSNPVAQKFFERGMESSSDRIMSDLLKALEEGAEI